MHEAEATPASVSDVPAAIGPLPVEAEAARRLERQRALVAIGRRALVVPDALILMQDAASLLAETLECEYSATATFEPHSEWLQLRLARLESDAAVPQVLAHAARVEGCTSLAGYALQVAHPVVVPDLSRETRFEDPLLREHGVVGALVVPLMLQDRSFGALGAYSVRQRPFDEEDVLFAETIAHLVATTIARADAEQSLARHRRLALGVLETVDALVLMLDDRGRITQINAACERIAGFSAEEIEGRLLWEAFAVPEEVEMIREALEEARQRLAPVRLESWLLSKHGRRLRIAWSCRTLNDADGEPESIIASGMDITEQRAAQKEAERAQLAAEEARITVARFSADGSAGADAGNRETRAFRQQLGPCNVERRARPRRSYPYTQRVAPIIDGKLPELNKFERIECNDIAAGGFSFLAPAPPISAMVVVALGVEPKTTYLTAQIAHVTRISHGGKRMFLVGCNYVGRASY